jgi:hypothetical protein
MGYGLGRRIYGGGQRQTYANDFCKGPMLCRVKVWGQMSRDSRKLVAQYRHVVAMQDVSELIKAMQNQPFGVGADNFNRAVYTCFEVTA